MSSTVTPSQNISPLAQNSLTKLMVLNQRAQRRQRLFFGGMLLAFLGLVALTVLNSYNWQQRLVEHSEMRTRHAADRLMEGFATNLAAMMQMHVRDLQFLTSLPEQDLRPELLNRFNWVHTWLAQVACGPGQSTGHLNSEGFPLFYKNFLSDKRFQWRAVASRPFSDVAGTLHIPIQVTAAPLNQAGKEISRICSAELLFGNQHASTDPDTAHVLMLLDNQHHVLAEWRHGQWQPPTEVPVTWLAHLEMPVQGTPWILSAHWSSRFSPDMQRLLLRLNLWTLLLLFAELILVLVASVWMYRRFIESRYQRAHQALHEMILESVSIEEMYARLVELSVLGAGALAAYVALPDELHARLPVVAASARKSGLEAVLRRLPLSLDPQVSPWGQLLPALAYQNRQRVDPRTLHVSGAMAKAIAHFPELNGFREVIAWPVTLEGETQPSAIFVLEITQLTHWLFGHSLIAHWESLLHDLERYLERMRNFRIKEQLLQTDTLTGLPNRSRFSELVALRLASAQTERRVLGLAVLDLDMFNEVNTTYGPSEADSCLQEIARQLQDAFQKDAVLLARIGGDEFGILVEPICEEQIEQISQKILTAVSGAGQRILDAGLTTSIGWSLYPEDGKEFYALIAQADEALAQAKFQGGNTYRLYAGEIARRAKQRLWVHRDFPMAIQRGDIRFFLQPKADMEAARLVGVEMLARWRSPAGQWISPGKFMPYVEENAHLIRLLGIWAMREAVRLRQRVRNEGLDLQVSLNIGAKHFLEPAFMTDIQAYCPDGRGLTLEITETASVVGRKSAQPIMEWCQSRGFRLSMDDFGTGYSSLLSVARLRFNELKLDQSFIRTYRRDIASFGVAGASRLLSQLIKCELVAEGISTPDELHLWLLLGGRYIQGYLLSPPLPENAFFTWRHSLLPINLRSTEVVALQDMSSLWQKLQQSF